jgi:hypothetical protein
VPDAGIKGILFMPNLYLENGKSRGKRIETGRGRGLRDMQGMNLAFATSRELRSRRGLDCLYRSEESMGGRG